MCVCDHDQQFYFKINLNICLPNQIIFSLNWSDIFFLFLFILFWIVFLAEKSLKYFKRKMSWTILFLLFRTHKLKSVILLKTNILNDRNIIMQLEHRWSCCVCPDHGVIAYLSVHFPLLVIEFCFSFFLFVHMRPGVLPEEGVLRPLTKDEWLSHSSNWL